MRRRAEGLCWALRRLLLCKKPSEQSSKEEGFLRRKSGDPATTTCRHSPPPTLIAAACELLKARFAAARYPFCSPLAPPAGAWAAALSRKAFSLGRLDMIYAPRFALVLAPPRRRRFAYKL